jgi:SAM-dependent methyltransferase
MGVDLYVLDFLLRRRSRPMRETLCLGRQGFHVSLTPQIQALMASHDDKVDLKALAGTTGYCETLLTYLGATRVSSMDVSDYEGATILHDLNTPVPGHLWESFDTIFDGGTIEHVFNVPAALENVKRMLRPGGHFISVNGANNFLGHGLYQFSPELFRQVFGPESGFTIETMELMPLTIPPAPSEVPASDGSRQEIRYTPNSTYLMVDVQRVSPMMIAPSTVYQGDYVLRWRGSRHA